MKVGISPKHDAKQLERFGIKALSMFDLRYMAESCGVEPGDLETMLRSLPENQSDMTNNAFPSNHAQAAVKLFQTFANKLQPEETQQQSGDRAIYVRNVIEKYCAQKFNKDYSEKEDRLKIAKIHVVADTDHCSEVIKEIKKYAPHFFGK